MTPGYTEFEFDLPGALLARLVMVFDEMSAAPLDASVAGAVPNEQGVYQLFLRGEGGSRLVYIGKTDAEAGLASRLVRHANKIQNRLNLNPADVTFKAIRVYVFTAVDLESQLINHYGGKVPWNGSGFGSNDPGRERDTTTYKAEHFDWQFPIDLSRPITFSIPSSGTAAQVLNSLKANLPFAIRFERPPRKRTVAHADLEETIVSLSADNAATAERAIAAVIQQLPSGWHATQLPSHVIIYKNDSRSFPNGRVIAKSP
jgi:hypothetical protein